MSWTDVTSPSSSWSTVSTLTPAVTVEISAGEAMGLLLSLTYAEDILIEVSPASGPDTTSWSQENNTQTNWS